MHAIPRVIVFVLAAIFGVLSWMLAWLIAYLFVQAVAQPWSWVLIMLSALTFAAFISTMITFEDAK